MGVTLVEVNKGSGLPSTESRELVGSGNISMWIKIPINSFSGRVSELRAGTMTLLRDHQCLMLYLLAFFSPLLPSKNPLSSLRVRKIGSN